MATKTGIPKLERITFFSGQGLRAKDLAALQEAQRELRWLHNRSLHQWGIGVGLGVRADRDGTTESGAELSAADLFKPESRRRFDRRRSSRPGRGSSRRCGFRLLFEDQVAHPLPRSCARYEVRQFLEQRRPRSMI